MGHEEEVEAVAVRRKRLAYQCAHRGMKEMDLILGRFADRSLARLNAAELDELEAVLAVADDLLYRWVSGAEGVPPEHASATLTRIIAQARGGSGAG